MTTKNKLGPEDVKTTVIAGKQVKVASHDAVMRSSAKLKDKYTKALDNLKNR